MNFTGAILGETRKEVETTATKVEPEPGIVADRLTYALLGKFLTERLDQQVAA